MNYNILVTGCMRSGTSLVAHLLNDNGIDIGKMDMVPFSNRNKKEHNKNGYFEIDCINKMENRILLDNSCEWTNKYSNKITVKNNKKYIDHIQNLVKIMNIKQPWLIKSNTFMRTMSLWKHNIDKLVVVYCFRNPKSVYNSLSTKLQNINDVTISKNYWKNHNLTFLQYLINNEIPTILINYDDLINNSHKVINHLSTKLKLFNINLNNNDPTKIITNKERHYHNDTKLHSNSLNITWNFLNNWYNEQLNNNDLLYIKNTNYDQIKNLLISDNNLCKPNKKCPCGSNLKYKKCCL
jgi:hypothetical protein